MTWASGSAAPPAGRRLHQVAAGLAVGHVVLMLTGLALQSTPSMDEGEEGILRSYGAGDVTRMLTGGYLEVLAFVMLLPVLVFLARAVGRRTEVGRWAGGVAAAFGTGYVAMTVGSGFAPGAAALWGIHHGLEPTTALAVNDIRSVAYVLGLTLLAAHALAVGSAALSDRWATRTVGWGGVVTGAVLLGSVPLAAVGLADAASLVWIVWWLALAVRLGRGTPGALVTAPDPRRGPRAVTG